MMSAQPPVAPALLRAAQQANETLAQLGRSLAGNPALERILARQDAFAAAFDTARKRLVG